MSKSLRVFLLSLLAAALCAGSALAQTYRITADNVAVDPFNGSPCFNFVDEDGNLAKNADGNVIGGYTPTNGRLYINGNGIFTFDDKFISDTLAAAPIINDIDLDFFGDARVTDATFVVPTPYPTDAPSEGTSGNWITHWPSQVRNNLDQKVTVSNSNRVKFTIQKRTTNSAILANAGLALFTHEDKRDATITQEVRNGWDFVLNTPIRVNQTTGNNLKVNVTVRDGGTMTFDREAEIFANNLTPNSPTGYNFAALGDDTVGAVGANDSTYDVNPGGELIIRNTWALRGINLTANIWPGVGTAARNKRATLTMDLPEGNTNDRRFRHDLRGLGDADGTDLIVDGNFNVLNDMELWGEIQTTGQYQETNQYNQADTVTYPVQEAPVSDTAAGTAGPGNINTHRQTFFKTGDARLVLSDDPDFEKPSLSIQLRFVNVEGGTLEFASKSTWWAGGLATAAGSVPPGFFYDETSVTPTVTVSEGATFKAGTQTIVDNTVGFTNINPVAFVVNGTAIFQHHAIYKRESSNMVFNEIYPYENYVTFNNGLLINARNIALTIGENGRVIVDNGAFAAGKIAGKGTIEIKNDKDPSRDRAVLILTEPYGIDNAVAKAARAAGTVPVLANALADDNYARSYIDFEGTIIGGNLGLYTPFATDIAYSRRIFYRTKSVDLDNLIVYGPAQLNVDANTKLDGIDNIWLRSHRPGARNYNSNGTVNTSIAYSKLNIGKLNFTPGERNTDIYVNSLKVDGSSSYEDMGEVRVLYTDNDTANSSTAIGSVVTDTKVNPYGNNIVSTRPRDYSAREAIIAYATSRVDLNSNGLYDDVAFTARGTNRDTLAVGPRLNAHIGKLTLYANTGEANDFPVNGYYNPASGIYAVKLNSAAQPSRILIDGTNVYGDGLAADFTNKFYQVEVTGKSDVRFTGDEGNEFYPVAQNNSIKVKQDGKLGIDRGAVINGHLAFEPSSTEDWPAYGRHWVLSETPDIGVNVDVNKGNTWKFNSAYPADEDFVGDEGWYDGLFGFANGFAFTNTGRQNGPTINNTVHRMLAGFLQNYTAFTTQVGERNRRDNDGGEYAVKVKGDLTLSTDDIKGYSGRGRVLMRAEPDLTAYNADADEAFTTIGARFKVIGEAEDGGDYTADFATPYNRFFLFRIPSVGADKKGVTVNNRDELAVLTMGEASFMKGASTFGMGDGYDFSVKVPFTIMYRGEQITLERVVDSNNDIHYYVGLGGNKYEVELLPTFFNYEEGMAQSNENVSDITALTTLATDIEQLEDNNVYVSDDIDVRAEFDTVYDSNGNVTEQFVRLIGESYSGEKPVNLRLALYLVRIVGEGVDWLDGVVPGFEEIQLVRSGIVIPSADPWSKATAENASATTVFDEGDTAAQVIFTVNGMRKVTSNVAAGNVGATTGTYYMLDGNRNEVPVTNLSIVRYNGDFQRKDTTTSTFEIDDSAITFNGVNKVTITLPVTALGDTGGKFSALKGLSVKGIRADGTELMTYPVSYTLRAKIADSNVVALDDATQTVKINGTKAEFRHDVTEIDGNDLHFVPYNLPAWLGFTTYDGGFGYNTGDLTGVSTDTYPFSVLVYNGEDSTSSAHKLYTFSVTVDPEEVVAPGITSDAADGKVSVQLPNGTAEVTLSFTGGASGTFAIAEHTNPATLLTLNGTKLTVSALGVAAGTYTYSITSGTLTPYTLTVTVEPEPEVPFEIVVVGEDGFDDGPIDGRTYTAVLTTSGAAGAVTWNFTDNTAGKYLKGAVSGDMFVIEGIAKLARDADDNDIDQSYTVTASDGSRTTEPYEVTFTVEEEDADIAAAFTTEGLVVTGDSSAVKEGYRVMFPAGTVADADTIFLPSWLKAVTNADDEVIGFEFAGNVGDLPKGTTANVIVEAVDAEGNDVYYRLPVTYDGTPAVTPTPGTDSPDLTLSAAPAALRLTAGTTATVTLTTNRAATITANQSWAVISGTTATITAPAAAGSYTVVFTATDAAGKTATASVAVTVTVAGTPTSPDQPGITSQDQPGPTSPDQPGITSPDQSGRDQTGTFSLSRRFVSRDIPMSSLPLTLSFDAIVSPVNALGTVSYTASVNAAGLTVALNNTTRTFTLNATQTGTYTVTITGTDSGRTTGNTATTSITVRVTGGGSVGSSGGGCDAGFGALALGLALPLFLRRRRS